MQDKMMAGFAEGLRVLKPGGHAVYNISVVDSLEDENTQKWIQLCMAVHSGQRLEEDKINDIKNWLQKCEKTGYHNNEAAKIYGELPAPCDDVFPFANEVFQWMAEYVVVSQK